VKNKLASSLAVSLGKAALNEIACNFELKSWYSLLPYLTFSIKKNIMKNKLASLFAVSLGKAALNEIASTSEWLDR